ncbi:hypothetical protein BDV11DRAFT_185743 [Aspergillus similis]
MSVQLTAWIVPVSLLSWLSTFNQCYSRAGEYYCYLYGRQRMLDGRLGWERTPGPGRARRSRASSSGGVSGTYDSVLYF